MNLRGRLENSSLPMKRRRISWTAGVPSMISSDGDAGHRRPEDHPRHVTAGLRGAQPDALDRLPDVRDVLDPHPVQLHVLPVGQVGGVPGVLGRHLADGAQRSGGQLPAVDPDPHHEVLVLELLRLQDRGAAAVDAGRALGVQPPPAHPAAQVARVDAVEAGVAVPVLDPLPHVQAVVVLLHPLVDVQRLPVPERPLALATGHGRSRPPGAAGPPPVGGAALGLRCGCRSIAQRGRLRAELSG